MPAKSTLLLRSSLMPPSARQPPSKLAPPGQTAQSTALRLLQRRPLSANELRARLGIKGHDPQATEAAVEAMQGFGYVNDPQFAAQFASQAQRAGRGPRWVQQRLSRRLIDAELAESAIAAAFADPAAVCAKAVDLLRRRFFSRAAPDADRQAAQRLQQRALRFLLGRGFNFDSAIRALRLAAAAPVASDDATDPAHFEETPAW
jgi:regulatory protein